MYYPTVAQILSQPFSTFLHEEFCDQRALVMNGNSVFDFMPVLHLYPDNDATKALHLGFFPRLRGIESSFTSLKLLTSSYY